MEPGGLRWSQWLSNLEHGSTRTSRREASSFRQFAPASGEILAPCHAAATRMSNTAVSSTTTRCCATFWITKLFEKAGRPERPGLLVGAEGGRPSQETGAASASPIGPVKMLDEREQSDQRNKNAGPMMVKLRPG